MGNVIEIKRNYKIDVIKCNNRQHNNQHHFKIYLTIKEINIQLMVITLKW